MTPQHVVCGFLVAFGVALFWIRPDPTLAQTAYRIGLVGIGLVGLEGLRRRRR